MKYDIKPIETYYSDVKFRSRLEASWAAFFDLMGWDWEYEPFELKGWFPDFLISHKKHGDGELLVEVKPFDFKNEKYYTDCARKITHNYHDEFLLVGANPMAANTVEEFWKNSGIGLLICRDTEDPSRGDFIDVAVLNYNGHYDIIGGWGSWKTRFSGEYDGDSLVKPISERTIEHYWKTARNSTQWKKYR